MNSQYFVIVQLIFLSFTESDLQDDLNHILNVYEHDGIIIRNNELLTDILRIAKFSLSPYASIPECRLLIENNSRLDLSEFCSTENILYMNEMVTRGNLVNCGCHGGEMSFTSSLDNYSECSMLYGGMNLTNITDTTSLSSLSTLQTIKGRFNIQNTNIQNLSFLSNLEDMEFYSRDRVINLQNNLNMTRVDLPALRHIKNTASVSYANFENLHPDFCVTIDEFVKFTDEWVAFEKLDAKLCEPPEKQEGLCHFKSMSELLNNCTTIIGNLVIQSGDEEYVTKLICLTYIFGTLTIQNTQLKNFTFFEKLECIVHLEDAKPDINIIGNKNLTSPQISTITAIHTRYNRTAIIQDNHPHIFNWTNGTCELFSNSPTKDNLFVTHRRILDYVGGDCGARVEISSVDSNIKAAIPLIIIFLSTSYQNVMNLQ